MTDNAQKEFKVTSDIRPGPATPYQRELWRKFWHRIVMEARKEAAK
jgi:hypothetical protein